MSVLNIIEPKTSAKTLRMQRKTGNSSADKVNAIDGDDGVSKYFFISAIYFIVSSSLA
jgi:hypothetical protein